MKARILLIAAAFALAALPAQAQWNGCHPPVPPEAPKIRFVGFPNATFARIFWRPQTSRENRFRLEWKQKQEADYETKVLDGWTQSLLIRGLDRNAVYNMRLRLERRDCVGRNFLGNCVSCSEIVYTPSAWTLYNFSIAGTPTSAETERLGMMTLAQNYPNPFNPATSITYELASPGPVRLEVFDATGRSVAVLADGVQPAGKHSVRFDATELPSGLYVYHLQAGSAALTRKMTLIR